MCSFPRRDTEMVSVMALALLFAMMSLMVKKMILMTVAMMMVMVMITVKTMMIIMVMVTMAFMRSAMLIDEELTRRNLSGIFAGSAAPSTTCC